MNKLMKTGLLSLAVAGLFLSACTDSSTVILNHSSDSLIDIAPTIAVLAGQSQLIVTGTVTGMGDTWNMARGADPTTASTTNIVLAQNFVLTVDATLKGTAVSQVTWAVAKGSGMEPFPPTLDPNWTPPTVGARYLLFLVKIPGTEIYGIPAEPSRFRLGTDAQAESKSPVAVQRYPAQSITSLLDEVRSAVTRP